MAEEEPWRCLLREALAVLALPAEEQARVNHPGCLACDLLNDFDHARAVALGNAVGLSEEQRGVLDRIEAAIKATGNADLECFDVEAVRRPVWQDLRELAAEALRAFDWEDARVQPFAEVRPGVWQRPPVPPDECD